MAIEWHPFAEKFGQVEDWEGFKASIAETKGNEIPVSYRMKNGKKQGVDGRNRELACEELGIKCKYEKVSVVDEDVTAWIIRRNIARRHLTPEQRRGIVADLREDGQTMAAIADTLNVSTSTVQTDLSVLQKNKTDDSNGEETSQESATETGTSEASQETATVVGKDGKAYPKKKKARKKKPILCDKCTDGPVIPTCVACQIKRDAAKTGKKKAPKPKPETEPEVQTPAGPETPEETMKRVNGQIESFCRSLMKFVADYMPDDHWVHDMDRHKTALRKFKDGCETLRSCKCASVCPQCQGKGKDGKRDCEPCHGTGRLPKLNKDML